MSIDIVIYIWQNSKCITESGVGGETRKGLQPYGLGALVSSPGIVALIV
jgi:hypothetical protein